MTSSQPNDPGKTTTVPNEAHRQIQAAHENYFREVAEVWGAAQSRFQSVQADFERAMERAWQAQDPNAYQTALADYQRAVESASAAACEAAPYNDAYRRYKQSIQTAIANADVDELNFTDVAHIGQSLSTVWPVAMRLSQSQAPPPSGVAASPTPAPPDER